MFDLGFKIGNSKFQFNSINNTGQRFTIHFILSFWLNKVEQRNRP